MPTPASTASEANHSPMAARRQASPVRAKGMCLMFTAAGGLVTGCLIAALFGRPFAVPWRAAPPAQPGAAAPAGLVHLLLLGKDERPDEIEAGAAGRTDTLMVLRIDFDHDYARLLSLPRDMVVALPHLEAHGLTAGKLNTAYHYGELYGLPGGGPQAAMDAIRLNFGIPLDHFIVVDFEGFVRGIDALGGIDVEVPKAIHDAQFPTDDYGVTTFVLQPGRQHMDGLTALRFARTRNQDNDVERMRRQQLVLWAIRDKVLSVDAVGRAPELYDALAGSIETDMSLTTLAAFGLAAGQIDRTRISTHVLTNAAIDAWTADPVSGLWLPRRPAIEPVIEAFLAEP